MDKKRYKEEEKCEACERLRKGLTWFGDPPTCYKHRKKGSLISRYVL